MSFTVLNSVASWFLKKRIGQIEEFVKYPVQTQQRLLLGLVQAAQHTQVGEQYGFKSITTYETFANRVPVSTYENLEQIIEQARQGKKNVFWHTPIKWFAKSSGTTAAKSKFIPISRQSLYDCHYKAGKDMLCLYLNNNENSKLFMGKSLRLGGSKELYKNNGTVFGDLSAILIDNLPFWAEFSSTPSNKVSLMSEWESKMTAIVQEAVHQNVTSLVGVPSWMLVLLNRVLAHTQNEHLLQVWQNLEVYFHGGVSFVPYKEQYMQLIPSTNFKYYETYNASEGFFAIQDRNHSDEMLLMLDYGIFYEFIPMNTFGTSAQKVVPLWEVQTDKNYAMVITTNAGLWRYLIGDTVRFTSTSPYRIKITGRTKHFINVFGEELIVENTDVALKRTCQALGAEIVEYTVAPIFMDSTGKNGGHQWLIEFAKAPTDVQAFAHRLDNELKTLNSDYEAKRYNDMTLTLPQLSVAKGGLFHTYLKKQGKLGGQHKVPRLSNSRNFLDDLLLLNEHI